MAKFSDLKTGSILGETQYYKVEKISGEKVQLATGAGHVVVDKNYVETYLNSGDQFSKEEKVTKTVLADTFINSPRVAMTVKYVKQDKPKSNRAYKAELADQVAAVKAKRITVESALANPVLPYIPGEERTMRGWHESHVDDMGRIQFTDMDATGSGAPLRLVDPRTIQWLIVNDVKYVLK